MAGPGIRKFPEDSLESKVYNMVEKYSGNIPVPNDRNRLAYSLIQYIKGEGDHPSILVKSTKITIEGISAEELAGKLNSEVEQLKQ
jgi:hypothetical protein